MGEYTTNKGLYKPARNERAWGKRVNDNWDIIDAETGGILPEFTAPVDADFSWINQGSATSTQQGDRVFIVDGTGTLSGGRMRVKTAPSTPYVITAAIMPRLHVQNYNWAGILFRQTSDGKFSSCRISEAAGAFPGIRADKWSSSTAFVADYDSHIMSYHGTVLWLRIADNGTNRIYDFSYDGNNWFEMHSVGRTDYLTADQVGFAVGDDGTHEAAMTLLSWDES